MTLKTVSFQNDYCFHPSPTALQNIPEEYQAGLQDGSLKLVLRRCCTPHLWCIVEALESPNVHDRWPASSIVHRFGLMGDSEPDMSSFVVQAKSEAIVDYGPHMARYIAMTQSPAFADQGLPLWTLYQFDEVRYQKLLKRRQHAEQAASWFNKQRNNAPCAVEALSDEALAVLTLPTTPGAPIWMYRSLADAVLQLVRAGFATVDPEGHATMSTDVVEAARQELNRRGLAVKFTNPEYIQRALDRYNRHPRRGTTAFEAKRKPPELKYALYPY
jgi:hypothetical protein